MAEVQPDAPMADSPALIIENDAPNEADTAKTPSVEELAMEMGWNPDFKGENARTAADWVRSTGRNNKNLTREMKEMKSSIDRIAQTADRQVKREVEAKAAEIQARFDAAIESQDKAAAARAANEMTALQAESVSPANVEESFARDNPWYGKDEDATAYAISVSTREARKGNTSPETQLRAVQEAVRKRFPELFPDAPKPPAALGDPGNRVIGKPRVKGYGDMPDVARGAADRFYEAAKMRGTAPDRKVFDAQYAKDYWNDQAA